MVLRSFLVYGLSSVPGSLVRGPACCADRPAKAGHYVRPAAPGTRAQERTKNQGQTRYEAPGTKDRPSARPVVTCAHARAAVALRRRADDVDCRRPAGR